MGDSKEHERRRWHFKKELSVGDLAAVAGTAVAVIWSYNLLEKRISFLEKDASVHKEQIVQTAALQKVVDTRQDEEALRYQARIDEALREINRKLDRLIERRAENERPR